MAYPDCYCQHKPPRIYNNGQEVTVDGREGVVVRWIHFNVYVVWFRGDYESSVIQL